MLLLLLLPVAPLLTLAGWPQVCLPVPAAAELLSTAVPKGPSPQAMASAGVCCKTGFSGALGYVWVR